MVLVCCSRSTQAETDSAAQRKKKLHTAMLRWDPDKFLAAYGGVLLPAERDSVLHEVNQHCLSPIRSKALGY